MFTNNFFFFFPFCYFIKTRISGLNKFLSWILIYFIPLLIIINYNHTGSGFDYLEFIMITSLIYCTYEIGYIYNDTETIKKETKPTLRLSISNLNFYYKYRWYVYIVRLLMIYTISFNIGLSVVAIVTILLILFFIYNNIRNRFNLVLHFILVIFRYSMPIFIITNNVMLTILSILCFPMINVIERCGEKRFELKFFQKGIFKNKSRLRVIYYLITFSLMLMMTTSYLSIVYCLFYYIIYRSLISFFYE